MLRGGGETFQRLLENLRTAVKHFRLVKVRMNLDRENSGEWKELTKLLEAAGLLDSLHFEIAAVDATNEANGNYKPSCLHPEEFSAQWLEFATSAYRRRDNGPLKLPKMTVCTKISDWSYVIAPEGACYGCWNDVGNPEKAIGHITDPDSLDQNREWTRFDPLNWPECRECALLPACMGRCPDLLEKQGPESACGRWKHCLREAVILHTMSKLKGGKYGKSGKQVERNGIGTGQHQ